MSALGGWVGGLGRVVDRRSAMAPYILGPLFLHRGSSNPFTYVRPSSRRMTSRGNYCNRTGGICCNEGPLERRQNRRIVSRLRRSRVARVGTRNRKYRF